MPKKYTVLAVDTRELTKLMPSSKPAREIWDAATGWCLVEAEDPEQAIFRARLQMIGEDGDGKGQPDPGAQTRLSEIVVLSVVLGWHEDINPF